MCIEDWKEEVWRKRAYSIFLFVAVYALPVSLVLTAYIRMGFKLCSPSVVNKAEGSEHYIYLIYERKKFDTCTGRHKYFNIKFKLA